MLWADPLLYLMGLVSLCSRNRSGFSRDGLITSLISTVEHGASAKLPIYSMRVNTSMIKFTAKAASDGSLRDQSTSEITFRDREKVMDSINIRMETPLKENG